MPERSAITEVVQIGVEATPGTAVAATKRLTGMRLRLNPRPTTSKFRASGYKYPTVQALNREWSEGGIEGPGTYTEIVYPLSGAIGTATVAAVGVGGAQSWTFNSSSTAEDVPKTFTIEQGQAVRAHRATYGLFREFSLNFSREDLTIGGGFMATAITDGVTLTATPTEIPLSPILPGQVSVFLDPTSAALGTTRLLRVLSGTVTIGSRWASLWTVDSSRSSWAAHVETEPTVRLELTVEADAEGMGHLTRLRTGDTRFVRFRAVGSTIGAGPETHEARFDFAAKVSAIADLTDEQEVIATKVTLDAFHDSGWGKAFQAYIVNQQTAL